MAEVVAEREGRKEAYARRGEMEAARPGWKVMIAFGAVAGMSRSYVDVSRQVGCCWAARGAERRDARRRRDRCAGETGTGGARGERKDVRRAREEGRARGAGAAKAACRCAGGRGSSVACEQLIARLYRRMSVRRMQCNAMRRGVVRMRVCVCVVARVLRFRASRRKNASRHAYLLK